MKIVVAGGSGFLGRALTSALAAGGHDVVVLTRRPRDSSRGVRFVAWQPDVSRSPAPLADWMREVDGAGAVVNLAGEGLADKRWSAARKVALKESRVSATRALVAAMAVASTRPPTLIQGSAIGYYGMSGDQVIDESAPAGADFLAEICSAWEAEGRAAETLGCRVVLLRSGVVLARDGGALQKLLPPFQLFVGGPIASGRQFLSWIHRDDWIAMVLWALRTAACGGPLNATAPAPATNADFSAALGRALHRPSWLRVPGFALRVLVGEMAEIALIHGQRVVPSKATSLGFQFTYPDLAGALGAAVAKS